MTSESLPEFIGTYKVVRKIGRGAYGQTFEVETVDGIRLALKLLRDSPADGGRERFENEAWALSQLDHPNIPKFIEKGEYDDRPYILMSLADGETLNSIYERKKERGGGFAVQEVLELLGEVLEALVHIHDKKIIHRDLKHDNLIVNLKLKRVHIVDLGTCKGENQPIDAATFWNAGARLFSPPDKLKNPKVAYPAHDVFAIGVIAYSLLTNAFPWTEDDETDRGVLEEKMRTTTPTKINFINTRVTKELNNFVMSLLVPEDHKRMTAKEALESVKEFLAQKQTSYSAIPPTIKFNRVMRDPIHGDIVMTDYEWQLINTPEFQRLRWIRQLGTSHLVYPGAEHTRFSHAIGTMHVASEILRRIEQTSGVLFDVEEKLLARTYALLHDISHIAYGHTLEDELGLFDRHDDNHPRVERLVLSEKSSLNKVLESTDYGQTVLELFNIYSTEIKKSWLLELVESPSGADVIDYVDRDSFFCGLDHKIDSAIFRRYKIDTSEPNNEERRHLLVKLHSKQGFRLDAQFALESILLERLALFMKVFTHQAKVAAGSMIGKAVWEVSKDEKKSTKKENKLTNRIEWMGDNELLIYLKNSNNTIAKNLIGKLLKRELYKPYYRAQVFALDNEISDHDYNAKKDDYERKGLFDFEKRSVMEAQIAAKSGLKNHEILIYCAPSAPGLKKVVHQVQQESGAKREEQRGMEQHKIIRMAHLKLWRVFVFAPHDIPKITMSAIAEEAYEIFGLKNELPGIPGRQGTLF